MFEVRVDKDKCIGCSSCVNMCPDIFVMEGDKAVSKQSIDKDEISKDASDVCPTAAIILTKKELKELPQATVN